MERGTENVSLSRDWGSISGSRPCIGKEPNTSLPFQAVGMMEGQLVVWPREPTRIRINGEGEEGITLHGAGRREDFICDSSIF